jgi:hypothetical protein
MISGNFDFQCAWIIGCCFHDIINKIKSPSDCGRSPGKTAAESCQTYNISFLDHFRFHCLTECNGNRSGRCIAIPLNIVPDLIIPESEFPLDKLRNPKIRLMRDYHIDITPVQTGFASPSKSLPEISPPPS